MWRFSSVRGWSWLFKIQYPLWFLEVLLPLVSKKPVPSCKNTHHVCGSMPYIFPFSLICPVWVKISKPSFLIKCLRNISCFRFWIKVFYFCCYFLRDSRLIDPSMECPVSFCRSRFQMPLVFSSSLELIIHHSLSWNGMDIVM